MTKQRFSKFLALSALAHILLAAVLLIAERQKPAPIQQIQVELVDRSKVKKFKKQIEPPSQQVVEQDEKPVNKETPENTKFLAQHNQKVLNETVAAHRGEFKNLKQKQKPGEKATKKQASTSQDKKPFNPLSDLNEQFKNKQLSEIGKNYEDREKAKAESQGGDTSQTTDYVKNVDQGLETLLNTKEFKYYTYFNRIRRQLSQHWEPNVRDRLSKMFRQGRSIASDVDKVTKLLITLNAEGQLVKVQILSDSGVNDLDEAAVDAFRSAAPFPNPPMGIVDADGTVKIRWDFVLES
jgi:TonB family protein